MPAVDVVHVGSASRDLTDDDPRGWRLGGGVTFAALTTARLGLRTAAVIKSVGQDAVEGTGDVFGGIGAQISGSGKARRRAAGGGVIYGEYPS